MIQVRVRVLRPFRVRGDVFVPGAIVALDPLDAFAAAGKCELLDPQDREVIAQAVGEANQAVLRLTRQRTDDPFGPWQRR